MSELTPRQILGAFDRALEVSSRWPRLLQALGYDMNVGRPGPPLLNRALEARGFGAVIDERESWLMLREYPETWWLAIAKDTTGNPDASVQEVIDRLRVRAPEQAAQ
jgi:hypothetical protein